MNFIEVLRIFKVGESRTEPGNQESGKRCQAPLHVAPFLGYLSFLHIMGSRTLK